MTLRTYDKRLLEFIYNLTLHQKLMNPREMAEHVVVQGKRVSERTIKRWLKFLCENYYFTYYPSVDYTKFGLVNALLFLNNVAADEILEIIPYKAYLMFGIDLRTLEKCHFVHYLIPKKKLREFERFWKLAVDGRLVGSYKLFLANQIIAAYSPFHKIIKNNGDLNFSVSLDNEYFLDLLKQKIYARKKIKLESNPFIVPVLIEYFKDIASSRKAWYRIKTKMGDKVWDYIDDYKIKKKKTNGVGITYIQKILRNLHTRFDDFFYQIRISYGPLYDNKINLLILLDLESRAKIHELICELSQKVLYVIACYSETGGVLLDLSTDHEKVHEILNVILPKYTYGVGTKIVWTNYGESKLYWNTESWLKSKYHKLFDPKTYSWIFDSQKYYSELLNLSQKFFK